jgi:hypothetical protein
VSPVTCENDCENESLFSYFRLFKCSLVIYSYFLLFFYSNLTAGGRLGGTPRSRDWIPTKIMVSHLSRAKQTKQKQSQPLILYYFHNIQSSTLLFRRVSIQSHNYTSFILHGGAVNINRPSQRFVFELQATPCS